MVLVSGARGSGMDRRNFLRAAASATGSLAVAGCLSDEDEDSITNVGDGPPRYDLPAYSGWPPDESHNGNGVVVMHLRLESLPAIQRAVDSGRLSTDQPLVGLPFYSAQTVPGAVETVTSYPFAAALRHEINAAAGMQREGDDTATNETVVEPINETAPVDGSLGRNTTETALENATAQLTNETTTQSTDEATADNRGIEVAELTLTDGLLICHGNYDQRVVADRYTAGFEQVDQQRGVSIYEGVGDNAGLAFGVGSDLLIVPTEDIARSTTAETVLAHSLSRYINTLGRIVDDENGEWLFETTGPADLSIGVWGTETPLGRIADTVGLAADVPTDAETGPIFGSVDGLISALETTVDESGTVTGVDTRFAGLFPNGIPTEDELRTNLGNDAASQEVFIDASRAHVTASFGDR